MAPVPVISSQMLCATTPHTAQQIYHFCYQQQAVYQQQFNRQYVT
jgi:hypothetical protein